MAMTSCSTKPPCCFFGFLRCAEFTNGTTQGCTSSPGDGRLQLFLLSSKTDPFGKGVTSGIGPSVPPYCPVRAIIIYPFVTRREGPEQLLFVLSNGQQLTRQSFTVTVWSRVAAPVYHPSRTPPGIRSTLGQPPPLLWLVTPTPFSEWQVCGKSDACLCYIRTTTSAKHQLSSRLAAVSWMP